MEFSAVGFEPMIFGMERARLLAVNHRLQLAMLNGKRESHLGFRSGQILCGN
jgi:hypothetical protein